MKRWTSLIPLFCIAAVLLIAWQIFGGTVMGFYYNIAAGQAKSSGALERAAALMEKQLAQTPKDDDLRLELSALYVEAGNLSRAEHIVQKGIDQTGPNTLLYTELCRVYALQDKFQDAVRLLEDIRSQPVAQALSAARPSPPVFDPPPNVYNERIAIQAVIPPGCTLYYSADGSIPSAQTGQYTEPFTLPDGTSELRAVLVDAAGLVSPWFVGFYTMENVVYPIEFQDAAMEGLIRQTINKPQGDIYTSDLWDIETLYSTESLPYATLADVQYLPALRVLSLTSTRQDCDITALSGLSQLRELRLEAFGLQSSQLEALASLTALETLNLSDNTLALLDSLQGLTGLQSLILAKNSLIKLEAIASLTQLTVLDLTQNAISNLRPLENMKRLEKLLLSENNLSVPDGLQALLSLRTLDLSGNPNLANVDEIAELAELEWFSAAHCSLTKLPDCKKLTKLKSVILEKNALESLAGLNAAISLEHLNAQDNAITSLQPMAEKSALKTLNVTGNQIQSVEPLSNLTALETLNIENNRLTTLLPLKSCPALKQVNAFGNTITDPYDAWDGTGVTVNRY